MRAPVFGPNVGHSRLPKFVLNFFDRGVRDPGIIAILALNRLNSVQQQENGSNGRLRIPANRNENNFKIQ